MKKILICTCNKVHDAGETKQQAEAAAPGAPPPADESAPRPMHAMPGHVPSAKS